MLFWLMNTDIYMIPSTVGGNFENLQRIPIPILANNIVTGP